MPGHDPVRGRDDCCTKATLDLGDVVVINVVTTARARCALDSGDHWTTIVGVTKHDADALAGLALWSCLDAEALDVALLLKDSDDFSLEL
jgi:hypothetical protein